MLKKATRLRDRLGDSSCCPRCQATDVKGGETYTCVSCGFVGAPREWVPRSKRLPIGAVGQIPAGSRIEHRSLNEGGDLFKIPASGKGNGLLFFGLIWTGFIALVTLPALLGSGGFSVDGEPVSSMAGLLVLGLFLLVFWGIGLGLLYAGVRSKYAKHLLRVQHGQFDYVQELFGRHKHKRLPLTEIESITAKEFYQQNYQPVYGVEVRGPQKKIRFGSSLTDDEKGWLVAELNALVFPAREESEVAMLVAGDAVVRRDRFHLLLSPPVMTLGDWVGGLVVAGMAGAFLALGLSRIMEDAGFFRWMWVGMSSLFLLGIVGGMAWSWRRGKMVTEVESDGTRLVVSQSFPGKVPKESSMELDSVVRVACYETGRSNDTGMWRCDVVGNGVLLKVFAWRKAEDTEAFVRELRERLGVPEPD